MASFRFIKLIIFQDKLIITQSIPIDPNFFKNMKSVKNKNYKNLNDTKNKKYHKDKKCSKLDNSDK